LQWNLTLRKWKCNYSWKKKKWKYIASWKRVTIFTPFDWIFTSKEWKYILKRVKIITLFQEVKKWRLYFHFLEMRFHCKKFRVYNYFVHYYFDGPKLFLNLYPFLNILTKLFFFLRAHRYDFYCFFHKRGNNFGRCFIFTLPLYALSLIRQNIRLVRVLSLSRLSNLKMIKAKSA